MAATDSTRDISDIETDGLCACDKIIALGSMIERLDLESKNTHANRLDTGTIGKMLVDAAMEARYALDQAVQRAMELENSEAANG